MKKIICVLLILLTLVGCKENKEETVVIHTGVLSGPTGMGMVGMMNGDYENYEFSLSPNANDIVAKLTNGDLEIGALPTNLASTLYNKTNGQYVVIALNCSSVLYILSSDDSIKNISDLSGKTIYAYGQAANPEYILNYILENNNLDDVDVIYKEANDISTMMISGEIDTCMLPIPAATTILLKNPNVKKVFSVEEEFNKAGADEKLVMGCLVANKEFVLNHKNEINEYIERYNDSISDVLNNIEVTSKQVVELGIVKDEMIAKNAIPDAGIMCVKGSDVKRMLEGYLKVLYKANPKSIGGSLPKSDFYYDGK